MKFIIGHNKDGQVTEEKRKEMKESRNRNRKRKAETGKDTVEEF